MKNYPCISPMYQEIDVTLFLGKNSKVVASGISRKEKNKQLFSRVLGSFYDVFPFKLKDLTFGLEAKQINTTRQKIIISDDSFSRNASERNKHEKIFQSDEYKEALEKFNEESKVERDKNSFMSSLDKDDCGGTCDNDASFSGTLRKYFRESIIHDVYQRGEARGRLLRSTAIGRAMGFSSCHRDIEVESRYGGTPNFSHAHGNYLPTDGFRSYVKEEEQEFLFLNLFDKMKERHSRLRSLDGILRQLENLGHAPADHTDGLNVELFDFQRQALKWAIERYA